MSVAAKRRAAVGIVFGVRFYRQVSIIRPPRPHLLLFGNFLFVFKAASLRPGSRPGLFALLWGLGYFQQQVAESLKASSRVTRLLPVLMAGDHYFAGSVDSGGKAAAKPRFDRVGN